MPTNYLVKSTNEFLSIVRELEYSENTLLASLDVKSLFTNVPVHDTIDIILKNAYHHSTLQPPTIPKKTMKDLLVLCTTHTPFRNYIYIYIMIMGICIYKLMVL